MKRHTLTMITKTVIWMMTRRRKTRWVWLSTKVGESRRSTIIQGMVLQTQMMSNRIIMIMKMHTMTMRRMKGMTVMKMGKKMMMTMKIKMKMMILMMMKTHRGDKCSSNNNNNNIAIKCHNI